MSILYSLVFFQQQHKALVYYDRVAHTSAPRFIGYGGLKIEGRTPHIAEVHAVAVHATTVGVVAVHRERIVRIARITRNSPFIKSHVHPIIICCCCIII